MAGKCRGSVTFFAVDKFHPVMATHRAQGQAVVYVENGQIVASKGDCSKPLRWPWPSRSPWVA
jgi:cyanophycin synthetase